MKKWTLLIVPTVFFALCVFYFVREYSFILKEPMTAWEVDPVADCAVVLTGGPGRVKEGFSLLARKLIKKLIIAGVHPDAELRDILPLWPFYGNMSEKDVVLERRSSSTYGNAQQAVPLVEALNCRDIVLVTSQIHMFRASKTFRSAFAATIPIYKHTVIAGRVESSFWDVSTEVLKSLFYSLWAY